MDRRLDKRISDLLVGDLTAAVFVSDEWKIDGLQILSPIPFRVHHHTESLAVDWARLMHAWSRPTELRILLEALFGVSSCTGIG